MPIVDACGGQRISLVSRNNRCLDIALRLPLTGRRISGTLKFQAATSFRGECFEVYRLHLFVFEIVFVGRAND